MFRLRLGPRILSWLGIPTFHQLIIIIIILKVFIQRKILSVETILSARARTCVCVYVRESSSGAWVCGTEHNRVRDATLEVLASKKTEESFPLLCDARRLIALVSVRVVKHALPACCLRRLGVHGAALPAPRVSFLPWDS